MKGHIMPSKNEANRQTVKYPGGVTAAAPTCHLCTWVAAGRKFRLKFASRACRQHRNLLR